MLQRPGTRGVACAAWLFVAGIVLFSGSLYALALTGARALGVVTPVGGVAFLAGWAGAVAWGAWRALTRAVRPPSVDLRARFLHHLRPLGRLGRDVLREVLRREPPAAIAPCAAQLFLRLGRREPLRDLAR